MGFTGASSLIVALACLLAAVWFIPEWGRRRREGALAADAQLLVRQLEVAMQPASTSQPPEERATTMEHLPEESTPAAELLTLNPAASTDAPADDAPTAAAPAVGAPRAAMSRLRRGRLLATSVLAVSLVLLLVGLVNAPLLVLVGLLGVVAAIAGLEQMRRVADRARARGVHQAEGGADASRTASAPKRTEIDFRLEATEPLVEVSSTLSGVDAREGWTPRALPKPRYLEHEAGEGRVSVADLVASTAGSTNPDGPDGPDGDGRYPRAVPPLPRRDDPTDRLMAAVRRSEEALRNRHREAGVATFGAVRAISVDDDAPLMQAHGAPEVVAAAAAPRSSSRWSSVGVVSADQIGDGALDVTSALRRRRVS